MEGSLEGRWPVDSLRKKVGLQFHPMKKWIVWTVLAILATATVLTEVDAHHSIAGVYDSAQQVTIEGVVTEFRFINPHPFVIAEVKQAGSVQEWKLEMDNRYELVDVGMTEKTLKRGDRIIVTGSPLRSSQAHGLYIRKLDRPLDGFQYEQVGSSPRIRQAR